MLGRAYFYTRDHLGSIRELTTSTGTIAARYDYDPYGVTTLVQGTNLADFQYAGMYVHQPSGYYLSATRAYSPNLGRWITRDPIGESGGLNVYAYCGNNPICFKDPSGCGPNGVSIALYNGYDVTEDEKKQDEFYKDNNLATGADFRAEASAQDYQIDTAGKTEEEIADAVDKLIKDNNITNITRIDVHDHGENGSQQLNLSIVPDPTTGYKTTLGVLPDPIFKRITDHLTTDGALYLDGCSVAGGKNGDAYLVSLAKYFNRDVYGSTQIEHAGDHSASHLMHVTPQGHVHTRIFDYDFSPR